MALGRQKRESDGEGAESAGEAGAGGGNPKYSRPKILAIDLSGAEVEVLRGAGYNAVRGTFGQPFRVTPSANYHFVAPVADLPQYTEQEIIVADLAPPAPADDGPDRDPPPQGLSVWATCKHGVVDPRPRVMRMVRDDFDRIFKHGGVFIFFLDPREDAGYISGETMSRGGVSPHGDLNLDNYDCLSALDRIHVNSDHGVEISVSESDAARSFLSSGAVTDARFTCTVAPAYDYKSEWIQLAANKYGDAVAAVLAPAHEGEGWIFLLPRLNNRGQVVKELLDGVVPYLAPQLFPHFEGTRWTRRPEYELPAVVDLRSQIDEVERTARERTAELEEKIEAQRHEFGFLHELLTQSGEELVAAVIATLKHLGFADVRNVDADEEEKSGRKREDIQIWDGEPTLLCEVKGIANLPKEAGALQVWKYIAPRMKEWKTTDVAGLSIINHQRRVPPLDRENIHVFQEDVVTNAEQEGLGLLTTWDLFRLARGSIRNGWRAEDIKPLVYGHGRIAPVPLHYQFLGVIKGFWEQAEAVGIEVVESELKIGDRVGFELKVDFFEEDVTSLQVDGGSVEQVVAGTHIGLKTRLPKALARDGVRVYKVVRGG